MKLLKKYSYILKFIIYLLLINTILTIISLIFYPNNKLIAILDLILINTYTVIKGLKSNQKGYLKGLKKGLIYILIMYIISCITLTYKINIEKILYYTIIITTTTLSHGIKRNKKRH